MHQQTLDAIQSRSPSLSPERSDNHRRCFGDAPHLLQRRSLVVPCKLPADGGGTRSCFKLPTREFKELRPVIWEPTLRPPVKHENLTLIDLEFGDCTDWLKGFGGTMLEKLEWAYLGHKQG